MAMTATASRKTLAGGYEIQCPRLGGGSRLGLCHLHPGLNQFDSFVSDLSECGSDKNSCSCLP
jgi:hypothetical protein